MQADKKVRLFRVPLLHLLSECERCEYDSEPLLSNGPP